MAQPTFKFVVACFNWPGGQDGQLPLALGGVYKVSRETGNGWAHGEDLMGTQTGFFPFSFVRQCTEAEIQQILASQSGTAQAAASAQQQAAMQVAQQQAAMAQQAAMQVQHQAAIAQQQQVASVQPVNSPQPVIQSKVENSIADESSPIPLRKSTDKGETKLNNSKGSEGREKRKKKKKSGSVIKEKAARRKSKKEKTPIPSMTRRGTISALSEFEEKAKQTELSWSQELLKSEKNLNKALIPEALIAYVIAFREFDKTIKTATATKDIEAGKKAIEVFDSAIETYEWNLFEWHSALKNQWQARSDQIYKKIENLQATLRKLVDYQQVRAFDPIEIESEIQEYLKQLENEKIIDFAKLSSSKTDILDKVIEKYRNLIENELENSEIVGLRVSFYDKILTNTSMATCHFVLCKLLQSLFAAASLIEDQRKSQPIYQVVEGLSARLPELSNELLHSNVNKLKIQFPFAVLLSKVVISWAVLRPQQITFEKSSNIEEFSNDVAYNFIYSYRDQVSNLSIVGAYQFAEVVVVRMLALIGNNQLDLTRPIVEQLISLLTLTVVPGHIKPNGATATILFNTTPTISVVIPSSIETSAFFSHILTEYKNYFLKNAISSNQTVPSNWQEAEIIVRSGWKVKIDQNFVKLTYPKFSAFDEFGEKYASPFMFTLLKEIGWGFPKDDFLSYESNSSNDSSRSPSNTASVNNEFVLSLQNQIQSQQAQIQTLQQTITQLNQAVSYYSQLIPAEQQARLQLTQQITQLSTKVQLLTSTGTSYSTHGGPATPNYPPPPQPFAPSDRAPTPSSLISRSVERVGFPSINSNGSSTAQTSDSESDSSSVDSSKASINRIANSKIFKAEKIEEDEEDSYDETSSTASVTE